MQQYKPNKEEEPGQPSLCGASSAMCRIRASHVGAAKAPPPRPAPSQYLAFLSRSHSCSIRIQLLTYYTSPPKFICLDYTARAIQFPLQVCLNSDNPESLPRSLTAAEASQLCGRQSYYCIWWLQGIAFAPICKADVSKTHLSARISRIGHNHAEPGNTMW